MKVLIIEDSEDFQELLAKTLSTNPEIHIVSQERNPKVAISKLEQLKPDTVILDLRLHGGSGIDVLSYIKEQNPGIKVIVLTNYANTQIQQICQRLGADYFLDKSNDFQQLPILLNKMMESGLELNKNS